MSFNWRKEFERQHGKLPEHSAGSHDPVGTAVPGRGSNTAEEAGCDYSSAASANLETEVHHGHDLQEAEAAPGAPETGDHPGERTPLSKSAALPGRRALPRKVRANDPVLSLLGAGDLTHLDVMAKDAGKTREQLAADLLADIIADDAEAHAEEPA